MLSLWIQFSPYFFAPITWMMVILGATIGSFLNVCIVRIPEGTFWAKHRSHCPACDALIPWYLNIPILSWLLLRGKARCCGAKISPQYLLVEILTAILFPLIYWHVPFVSGGGAALFWDPANLIRAVHMAIFSSLMIICAVIDWRLMIIPDVISLPMIALTPVVVWLHPDLDWQSALWGVLAGFGLLYGIAWIYWLLRREVGMGMGDVKLLAAIGGWLGVQAIVPTVLMGSLSGALWGVSFMLASRRINMKLALPFGPFLVAGALMHLFFGGMIQEFFLFK